MGKTPPKETDAEGSPRKKAARLATIPESSPLTLEGAGPGRARDEKKRCNCNHVITEDAVDELVAIQEAIPRLKPTEKWTCYGCLSEDMQGIARVRPEKSEILICVTCLDHHCSGVGLVAYPFGHSREHALREKHWYAVLYCDPERGYCFKCNAEVPKAVGNEVGLQMIRDIVWQKLLAPPPSVGQTEAEVNPKKVEVNPKKVEITGKVQAESHRSVFDVDLPSCGPRSSDAQGYAITGIPNLGHTCYMSAVLQCLLVLGKLRERMLALDHPTGLLVALTELFVEASAEGDELDPRKVLGGVGRRDVTYSVVGPMQDSHEFLMVLWNSLRESEKTFSKQSNAIDSIFGFEMLQTLSCKKCGLSLSPQFCCDLKLDFPSKWHPTESAASSQTSKVPTPQKRETAVRLFGSNIGSKVIVEKTHKPLEVDSTQAQRISQSKDVVQSPLQIQKGKSVDPLIEDSIVIEDLLFLFCENEVKCPNCAKDHKEPSAGQSKTREQTVGSSIEDDVGDTAKTSRFATLPPVLTLHINRTSYPEGTSMVEIMRGNIVGIKISGHVRFMEYLDVQRFVDPSSLDNGSTLYRLAGVVEHIGKGPLKDDNGHYIAYVRARKLRSQQEGTWFCANDCQIRQVTLEQVLNCEAFILFYERMELA